MKQSQPCRGQQEASLLAFSSQNTDQVGHLLSEDPSLLGRQKLLKMTYGC